MAKIEVIVGDQHGCWGDFIDLLSRCGALNSHGEKNKNYRVTQLGDFPNVGYGQQDHAGHDEAFALIDTAVIGNHEYPALGGVQFDGYEKADHKTVAQIQRNWYKGKYKAAARIGNHLVTHAGLSKSLYEYCHYDQCDNLQQIVDDLNDRFYYHVFNAQFGTGGSAPIFDSGDGVLWLRWKYLFETPSWFTDFPQIVGHTHIGRPCKEGETYRVVGSEEFAAVVTDDNGKTFELVTMPNLGAEKIVKAMIEAERKEAEKIARSGRTD